MWLCRSPFQKKSLSGRLVLTRVTKKEIFSVGESKFFKFQRLRQQLSNFYFHYLNKAFKWGVWCDFMRMLSERR